MTSIEIFCCYARKDQTLLSELKAHLTSLQRQGLITMWADTNIDAGAKWEEEIEKHLDTAQIILLLVSPDFIASDYCYSREMKRAMERHECGEARVLPIILRPVYWQATPFGKLQVLPTDAKPVTSSRWHNLDEAFFDVAEGIRKTVEQLITEHSADSGMVPEAIIHPPSSLHEEPDLLIDNLKQAEAEPPPPPSAPVTLSSTENVADSGMIVFPPPRPQGRITGKLPPIPAVVPVSSTVFSESAEKRKKAGASYEQIIYISPEEDFTNVRERLEQTDTQRIILFIPPQTQLRSHVGWRLLHARMREMGKDVVIDTSNRQIRAVAKAAGFRVTDSLESSAANESGSANRSGRNFSRGKAPSRPRNRFGRGTSESRSTIQRSAPPRGSVPLNDQPLSSPFQDEESDLLIDDFKQAQYFRQAAQMTNVDAARAKPVSMPEQHGLIPMEELDTDVPDVGDIPISNIVDDDFEDLGDEGDIVDPYASSPRSWAEPVIDEPELAEPPRVYGLRPSNSLAGSVSDSSYEDGDIEDEEWDVLKPPEQPIRPAPSVRGTGLPVSAVGNRPHQPVISPQPRMTTGTPPARVGNVPPPPSSVGGRLPQPIISSQSRTATGTSAARRPVASLSSRQPAAKELPWGWSFFFLGLLGIELLLPDTWAFIKWTLIIVTSIALIFTVTMLFKRLMQ